MTGSDRLFLHLFISFILIGLIPTVEARSSWCNVLEKIKEASAGGGVKNASSRIAVPMVASLAIHA